MTRQQDPAAASPTPAALRSPSRSPSARRTHGARRPCLSLGADGRLLGDRLLRDLPASVRHRRPIPTLLLRLLLGGCGASTAFGVRPGGGVAAGGAP